RRSQWRELRTIAESVRVRDCAGREPTFGAVLRERMPSADLSPTVEELLARLAAGGAGPGAGPAWANLRVFLNRQPVPLPARRGRPPMTTLWLAIAEAVRVEHLVYGRVSWCRIAREFQARGWDFRHLGADTARRLKWGYERWT